MNNLKCNSPKAVGTELFERVDELLRLDADTGKLYWRVNRGGTARAGSEAGCLKTGGYRQVTIGGKLYLSHRIVYLLTRGYIPELSLDHINGNKSDNRPSNLREASVQCNNRNSKQFTNNKSGITGVHWVKRDNKWQAQIRISNKAKYLGLHKTKLSAAKARLQAEIENNYPDCQKQLAGTASEYIAKFNK